MWATEAGQAMAQCCYLVLVLIYLLVAVLTSSYLFLN
jgi:hypothetical protein